MSDDMKPRVVAEVAEHIPILPRPTSYKTLQLQYAARARANRGRGFNDLPRAQQGWGRQ